jgi:polyhydroxyalkanoate synthesis regulator phasin
MVAQGIARAQVLSTEINALQAASDQMVSKGIWTQQQADENMQYWKNRAQDAQQTKQMDGEFSSWFTNG